MWKKKMRAIKTQMCLKCGHVEVEALLDEEGLRGLCSDLARAPQVAQSLIKTVVGNVEKPIYRSKK
jgi:hypothetical protein